MNDQSYLRDLAERLMHVPVMYGVDQGDTDNLISIAKRLLQADDTSWEFDRYINGELMAEGVTVENARSQKEAILISVKIAPRGPYGESPVLVMLRSGNNEPPER